MQIKSFAAEFVNSDLLIYHTIPLSLLLTRVCLREKLNVNDKSQVENKLILGKLRFAHESFHLKMLKSI
jgi:hypothetical protein